MSKKTRLIVLIGIIFLIVMTLVFYVIITGSKPNNEERESVSSFPAATFEYVNDAGYKVITSEIGSLSTFDSLCLKPSDEEFNEDWIYRIVFNPKVIMPDSTEFVILFGEHSLSINGKTYVADDDVDYADILNWAAAKYKFFDYELIQE